MPEDELSQLRAEVALLRAQQQQYEARERETEVERQRYAEFVRWIGLSAQEKTQLAADRKFAGQPGDLWEVELVEQPMIRLPATSYYDAIGRYAELCGITETAHRYRAVNLTHPAEGAPVEELPPGGREASATPVPPAAQHGKKSAQLKGR